MNLLETWPKEVTETLRDINSSINVQNNPFLCAAELLWCESTFRALKMHTIICRVFRELRWQTFRGGNILNFFMLCSHCSVPSFVVLIMEYVLSISKRQHCAGIGGSTMNKMSSSAYSWGFLSPRAQETSYCLFGSCNPRWHMLGQGSWSTEWAQRKLTYQTLGCVVMGGEVQPKIWTMT